MDLTSSSPSDFLWEVLTIVINLHLRHSRVLFHGRMQTNVHEAQKEARAQHWCCEHQAEQGSEATAAPSRRMAEGYLRVCGWQKGSCTTENTLQHRWLTKATTHRASLAREPRTRESTSSATFSAYVSVCTYIRCRGGALWIFLQEIYVLSKFFKDFLKFMCIGVDLCICHVCACVLRSQSRVLDPRSQNCNRLWVTQDGIENWIVK